MKKLERLFVLLLIIIAASSPDSLCQVDLDVETGIAFSGYNDVRIPGDEGTLFSLSEELNADPGVFFRVRATYNFNEHNHLGILYAPLTINSSGELDRDLIFEGETFPAGTPLESSYKFNSYRMFYRYDFLRNDKIEIGAGLTAKIRDAEIRFILTAWSLNLAC